MTRPHTAPEEQVADASIDEQSLQDKLKDVISVKVDEIGSLRKKVVITIPRANIDEQLDNRYDELREKASVPGFRPGRAPQKLIEKRFGGEVGEEVNHQLVSSAYLAGIEKESIDALGDPLVRVTVSEDRADKKGNAQSVDVEQLLPLSEALPHLKCPTDGDWDIECEVEVRPVFELPDLKGIKVSKPELKVAKKDVDEEIKRMNMMRGTYMPVEDGKTVADDVVVGSMTVVCDGSTIKTEDDAELAVRDQRYDGILMEGFGKAATGKKIGDKVSVKVTLPDDYTDVELRSKPAEVTLAIAQVKRLEVPELDDEYLSSIGFEKRKEFEDYIKENMQQSLDQQVRKEMRQQVKDHLLELADFDVPEGVSQRHTEHLVGQQMMNLYRQGIPDSEISKHADELRLEASARARSELKLVFIMDKISEENDVNISEEEVNNAIAMIAARRNRRFDRVRDEIISTGHLRTLYVQLRDEKILEMLLGDAEITEGAPKKKAASDKKTTKKKTATKTKKKKADDKK
ncbi:MAG: trigger factor [Phycisphaerae bacterium]|nr:MAG: trigger factor [Phycisphaerae bacterium]